MRRNRRTLVAVLLVLLHVLAPGLHLLQHAFAARGAREGSSGACGHACCHAAVEAPQHREPRRTDAPASERSGHEHDHDCELCSQLHRLHGYVAPSTTTAPCSTRIEIAMVVGAPATADAACIDLPPVRAPPTNEA